MIMKKKKKIMIQVMVVERIIERMSGMMPRAKYDVDYIINTITENYNQLKENNLKASLIFASHF